MRERPVDVEDIDAVLEAPASDGDDAKEDVGDGEELVSDLTGLVWSAFVVGQGLHSDGGVAETVNGDLIDFMIREALIRRSEDADGTDLTIDAADELAHPGNLAVFVITSVGRGDYGDVEISFVFHEIDLGKSE